MHGEYNVKFKIKVLIEMEGNAMDMTYNAHDEMKVRILSSCNLEESKRRLSRGWVDNIKPNVVVD
jgi:hypothetical protein